MALTEEERRKRHNAYHKEWRKKNPEKWKAILIRCLSKQLDNLEKENQTKREVI